jgi:hypothetical protein
VTSSAYELGKAVGSAQCTLKATEEWLDLKKRIRELERENAELRSEIQGFADWTEDME